MTEHDFSNGEQMDFLAEIGQLNEEIDQLNNESQSFPTRPQAVGRNEPCPCGSGKKYKKCCGSGSNPFEQDLDKMAAGKPDTGPAIADEPTMEQWAELYSVAKNVRLLAPWQFLWDMDLITIMLPGREEPVFCSVMGRAGECYAIGVYPGIESIKGLFLIADSQKGEPNFISALEQNCLLCYFGDREELYPKERKLIKELGLNFRGRNEWIYFRAMEPGYYPWYITSEQADLLTQTLKNLFMACIHLLEEKIKVDFEGGETLLRYYSPEKKLWLNAAVELPPIPDNRPIVSTGNEVLTAKLKKTECSGKRIEFEVTWLPTPIQEDKNDRPRFPRLALLVDRKSGFILKQKVADVDESVETIIIELFAGFIEKFGRPESIYVRNTYKARHIEDFCRKIDVKLIEGQGMPGVDEFLAEIADHAR